MQFLPDRATVVSFGSLEIKWYAVLILCGVFISYYFCKQNFKKRGLPISLLEDLFFGCLLSGIVGARLWYVLFYDPVGYLTDPIRILNLQEGGLAIHGGLIVGSLFGYWYLRKKHYTFMTIADEVLYTVLLAQAVGRWGNFMNQEAYGPIVSENYFLFITDFIKQGMFIDGQYRMPTFLMESLLNIVGFILIHYGLRRWNRYKRGDLVYAYMMWTGLVRFYIESFRTDALLIANTGLRIAQLISLTLLVVGMLGTFGVFRKLFRVKPLLLFDFDGTLIDSVSATKQAFVEIFETTQPNHSVTDEWLDTLVGPSLLDTFTTYTPQADAQELIKQFREIITTKAQAQMRAMPGSEEVLKTLKQQGYRIGIVSNKVTYMIDQQLKQIGLASYIDLVIGSDLVERVKPDPQGARMVLNRLHGYYDAVVMVGDSVDDVLLGQRLNAYTIALVHNPHRLELIQEAKPNQIITQLPSLLSILQEERTWIYNTK